MEQYISLDTLKPNEKNPRKITKARMKKLRESLDEFTKMLEVRGLIIDDKNVILGGNQRYQALLALGYKEIPSKWVKKIPKDWTKEDIRQFIIKDNISFGAWDSEILANDYTDLPLENYGLQPTDWTNPTEKEGKVSPDLLPSVEEPFCQEGDLWQLGNHRVICGDATDPNVFKKLMGGKKAALVFTDPPYGIAYDAGERSSGNGKDWNILINDDLKGDAFFAFLSKTMGNIYAHITDNAAIYVWHASKTQTIFEQAMLSNNMEIRQSLVWVKSMNFDRADYHWSHEMCYYAKKKNGSPTWYGDRTHKTIMLEEPQEIGKKSKAELLEILQTLMECKTTLFVSKDGATTYMHPTQKPVELSKIAIKNSSRIKDIVMDCFLGSGSTLIGCEITGRACYGAELDPKYCDVVVRRWEQFTGEKAVKL